MSTLNYPSLPAWAHSTPPFACAAAQYCVCYPYMLLSRRSSWPCWHVLHDAAASSRAAAPSPNRQQRRPWGLTAACDCHDRCAPVRLCECLC